ncbi:MAG: leucine-rich repeat domain-containing protein [Bacteroidales bacterium]
MSRYEVRNKDYVTYLAWLKHVFDYPEVYEQALPDTTLYSNYLFNPAYKNYPVLGISKGQALNYCKWLTDRFNEFLLIDEELFLEVPNEMNEEHFETEAYLAGQFNGIIKNGLPSANLQGRIAYWPDKLMVPTFRLPSQEEIEFIKQLDQNQEDQLKYSKTKRKKPYGKKYFLDLFYHWYIEIDPNWEGSRFQFYLDDITPESNPYDLAPVCNDNKHQIFNNLNGNANEWISKGYNSEPLIEKINLELIKKDSMGSMPYLVFKDNRIGMPLFIDKDYPNTQFIKMGDNKHKGFRVAMCALNKPNSQTYYSIKKALKTPKDVIFLNLVAYKEKHRQKLPNDLGFIFKNTRFLHIGNYELKSVPKIGSMRNLIELNLAGNSISNLPPDFYKMNSLRLLNLDYNNLNIFPEEIKKLNRLTTLQIRGNNISSMPEGYSGLEKLEVFDISHNNLDSIAISFGELKNLKTLDLSNNKLLFLPMSFGYLKKLNRLDLSNNALKCLPGSLENMKNIEVMDVSSNNLESLPVNFGKLEKLYDLDLSNNQLSGIADIIVQLENIQKLKLSSNNLSEEEKQKIENWFYSREGVSRDNYDYKLYLE